MEQHYKVGIIGAGFSGLGMAIKLKQSGMTDFVVFERADDVGGTWRENTYPGCQCDVPSHLYSFSFALNSDWTRTYPLQSEIWDYMRAIAGAAMASRRSFATDVTCGRRRGMRTRNSGASPLPASTWTYRQEMRRFDPAAYSLKRAAQTT